jgi:hypothetical protein
LDAAAVMTPSYWSEDARSTVNIFTAFLGSFYAVEKQIWPNHLDRGALEAHLTRCNIYEFIQRLIFNDIRFYVKPLEDCMANLRQIREEVGIPMEFDLAKRFHGIQLRYHQQGHEI